MAAETIRLPQPLLTKVIIHGIQDAVIPYETGHRTVDVLKEKDQFVSVEQGMHNNLSNFES